MAWLAGFSLISPLLVLVTGFLLFALKWVFAGGLILITAGMILGDPEMESWLMGMLNFNGFGAWMEAVAPWAVASLGVTLLVGGLTLLGLRRTGAQRWHPAFQGMLAGLAGVLAVVVAAIFTI